MITRKKIVAFVTSLALLATITVINVGQAIACTGTECGCSGGGC